MAVPQELPLRRERDRIRDAASALASGSNATSRLAKASGWKKRSTWKQPTSIADTPAAWYACTAAVAASLLLNEWPWPPALIVQGQTTGSVLPRRLRPLSITPMAASRPGGRCQAASARDAARSHTWLGSLPGSSARLDAEGI